MKQHATLQQTHIADKAAYEKEKGSPVSFVIISRYVSHSSYPSLDYQSLEKPKEEKPKKEKAATKEEKKPVAKPASTAKKAAAPTPVKAPEPESDDSDDSVRSSLPTLSSIQVRSH